MTSETQSVRQTLLLFSKSDRRLARCGWDSLSLIQHDLSHYFISVSSLKCTHQMNRRANQT